MGWIFTISEEEKEKTDMYQRYIPRRHSCTVRYQRSIRFTETSEKLWSSGRQEPQNPQQGFETKRGRSETARGRAH